MESLIKGHENQPSELHLNHRNAFILQKKVIERIFPPKKDMYTAKSKVTFTVKKITTDLLMFDDKFHFF